MENIKKILDSVDSVIVGKKQVQELILTAMLARGHVLLEDIPGVGKTTLANVYAKVFDCTFKRIQFTPDTMPGDVIGSSVYNFETHSFQYVSGAIMGNIILADEINRTSPKTQAAMLEAMEEGMVTIDGVRHELPKPFVVIATQNPVMQRGTYHLPESQLDRFMMKLSMGYPDVESSVEIVKRQIGGKTVAALSHVVDISTWQMLIEKASKVVVSDELITYAANCIELTRTDEKVLFGASPRALIAWVNGAKAYALIKGREYCIPDDFKYLSQYVLAHRLILKQNTLDSEDICKDIVERILRKVKVPIG
ncbi:MAG: AAA family ATPase [Lachnospiraceae bacterium]